MDPSPMITYYDDASGEHVALTAAEVGTWSAATAALLTDECGLLAGARVGVLLPPHWQTAVVLLGAWSVGMEVSFRGWGPAGLSSADLSAADSSAARLPAARLATARLATARSSAAGSSPGGMLLDAAFVATRRVGSWLEEVPEARHRFSLFGPAPAGYRDLEAALRPHLGSPAPSWSPAADDVAAAGGVTFGEYGSLAREVAASRGISRGDRVLIDTAASEEPLLWLMAPLSAGASIVLCASPEPSRIEELVATERITKVFAPAT